MRDSRNLVPLKESEFDVSRDQPDPRGWPVFGSDRRGIGEVDDLIVDTTDQTVHYLDIEVDAEGLGLPENRRHALVPLERARLDEREGNVFLEGIASGEIVAMPSTVRDIGGEPEARHRAPEQLPERHERQELAEPETHLTRSEEDLVVGKQMVESGEVEVGKHVETEHVRQPVTRMHEEVDVERHPVEAAEGRDTRIDEEEIHIPIREEEVVVEKRPRVREEMIVRKRPVEEEEDVEADIRKERFYVEEHDRDEEMMRRREREEP